MMFAFCMVPGLDESDRDRDDPKSESESDASEQEPGSSEEPVNQKQPPDQETTYVINALEELGIVSIIVFLISYMYLELRSL